MEHIWQKGWFILRPIQMVQIPSVNFGPLFQPSTPFTSIPLISKPQFPPAKSTLNPIQSRAQSQIIRYFKSPFLSPHHALHYHHISFPPHISFYPHPYSFSPTHTRSHYFTDLHTNIKHFHLINMVVKCPNFTSPNHHQTITKPSPTHQLPQLYQKSPHISPLNPPLSIHITSPLINSHTSSHITLHSTSPPRAHSLSPSNPNCLKYQPHLSQSSPITPPT